MNRHQVLCGAANAGDHTFATGAVDGLHFTAYGSGGSIIIVDGSFARVQVIPLQSDTDCLLVTCLDASHITGKIAAACGGCVQIFEPVVHKADEKTQKEHFGYVWNPAGTVNTDGAVTVLSWNHDGSRLLTGGKQLQLWQSNQPDKIQQDLFGDLADSSAQPQWQVIWYTRPASPVIQLAFSPDGTYFASFAQNDRLVKIWFENKAAQHPLMRTDSISPKKQELYYSFIYVSHPQTVTSFSWRRTSKYMPRGMIGNVLITSCKDNVCRIWCETGDNRGHFGDLAKDSSAVNAFHHNLIQQAQHARTSSGPKKIRLSSKPSDLAVTAPSVHDHHKFGPHVTNIYCHVHFHLSGSINLNTDIPLVPTNVSSDKACPLVVHWLNNKELHLATQANKLIEQLPLALDGSGEVENTPDSSGQPSATTDTLIDFGPDLTRQLTVTEQTVQVSDRRSVEEQKQAEVLRKMEALLREWQQSPDMLFSIHPLDGSFLVWLVEWLDGSINGSYRQVQISFSSRIPQALPMGDAISLQAGLLMYYNLEQVNPVATISMRVKGAHKEMVPSPSVFMVTSHSSGSLCLSRVHFVEASSFSTVLSITPMARVCGHRSKIDGMTCHPVLPVLVTTSHQQTPLPPQCATRCQSELILWRVEPVGPLSQSGGVTEMTRLDSTQSDAFTHTTWLPTLIPSWLLGQSCNSPSVMFVTAEGRQLRLYLAIIDARSLLPQLAMHSKSEMPSLVSTPSSSSGCAMEACSSAGGAMVNHLVSSQSGQRPGCILALDTVAEVAEDWEEIQLLHMFHDNLVTGGAYTQPPDSCMSTEEHFFLVAQGWLKAGGAVLRMWRITISHLGEDMFDSDDNQGPGLQRSTSKYAPLQQRFSVATTMVCDQRLNLPQGVTISSTTVSAGHLSSASIYPACLAPYLISTACSDRKVRFWSCKPEGESKNRFSWAEWDMVAAEDYTAIDMPGHSSQFETAGRPVAVSCAYSGRVAVAFRSRGSRKQTSGDQTKPYNLWVSIYECESTGGSEWCKEDTIGLQTGQDSQRLSQGAIAGDPTMLVSPGEGRPAIIHSSHDHGPLLQPPQQKPAVPEPPLTVLLDWAPTEDGSHLLTVSVGSKVLIYAPVSEEVAEATHKEEKTSHPPPPRGLLQKSKSVTMVASQDQIQWIKLRSLDLSQEGINKQIPSRLSWLRDGLLTLGLNSELHVYTQWQQISAEQPSLVLDVSDPKEDMDLGLQNTLMVADKNLQRVASGGSLSSMIGASKSFKSSISTSSLRQASSMVGISKLFDQVEGHKKKREASRPELKKDDSISSMQVMQECGLFEAAKMANPVLPQYHPKQLIELLNFGKMRRVKAILAHLVRCVAGYDSMSPYNRELAEANRPRAHSRTRSVSGPGGSVVEVDVIPGEVHLDYVEIVAIPPLPLYALLEADDESTSGTETASDLLRSDPFGNPDPRLSDSSYDAEDDVFGHQESIEVEDTPDTTKFGPNQAKLLSKYLVHMHLPGLSSLDQMYLAALADTLANAKLDLVDDGTGQVSKSLETLDECGMGYMLAMRHHIYLQRVLPLGQRLQLQKQGLQPSNYVWAFYSDSQEELMNMIPGIAKNEPTWAELRQLGVGWWLRSNLLLRNCIEKVAKTAFQAKKDPLDAALFYLAMKKKNVLWGLFRSVSDTKMVQFFKNNFGEDRWRRAALKNAFALLGRQRFEHAVAFFLLAGNLRDALEVCLNKMNDMQLAVVITRLYETELDDSMPPNLVRILREECIGYDQEGDIDPSRAHPDPFIRSMAHWMQKEYTMAVQTLLDQGDSNRTRVSTDLGDSSPEVNLPSVFNFYVYLRSHPLVVRQKLLQEEKLGGAVFNLAGQTQATYTGAITTVERRLYFTAAHAHLKAGCPALALEVLAKLPAQSLASTKKDTSKESEVPFPDEDHKEIVETGTIDWSQSIVASSGKDFGGELDWSTPVSLQNKEDDDLKLNWSDDEAVDDEEETETGTVVAVAGSEHTDDPEDTEDLEEEAGPQRQDIMAQQIKFISCLKIMMEELSTLATGFEVDGSQLRFQLYIWLEKCVECLRTLCGYDPPGLEESGSDSDSAGKGEAKLASENKEPTVSGPRPLSRVMSLHEVILAEKMDFDAKVERLHKRKLWLRTHQQLLRTLLSYSELHGACGGGLASVRMELILLLQELQQDQPSRQLSQPLPLPMTLPLLAASLARSKTVIADPIRHLQSATQEILRTITQQTDPPSLTVPLKQVLLLRDMCAALSSCIYQSLCDVDSFVVSMSGENRIGLEGFTSTTVVYQDSCLFAGARQRQRSGSNETKAPNIPAAKWPGVSTLRSVLTHQREEDAPKLNILLCEALVGVYMSLLTYALTLYNANILYRLVAHPLVENMWPAVFGGGLKTVVQGVETSPSPAAGMNPSIQDDIAKQRMKFNLKVMGGPPQSSQTFRENTIEQFVSPELSILSYIMAKPFAMPTEPCVDYDSAESSSDEEEEAEEEDAATQEKIGMLEHADPHSYSWSVLRYAIVRFVTGNLKIFLPQVGIEIGELPVSSPLLHDMLGVLESWESTLLTQLEEMGGPPDDFIPGCYPDPTVPLTAKYKAMMDPTNTPFLSTSREAMPCKRLWHFMVKQGSLRDVFIRYIFKKRRPVFTIDSVDGDEESREIKPVTSYPEPMRVVHREQDAITAFCINQANLNYVTISTPKEVMELDISHLLQPPAWLGDETEYDIERIQNAVPTGREPDFLVVQTPQDRQLELEGNIPTAPGVMPAPNMQSMGPRGGSVGKGFSLPGIHGGSHSAYIVDRSNRLIRRHARHQVNGVKRMASHPSLPYYLTGSQDGCVKLWEWGHYDNIATAREPGAFPKVTRVHFNDHGNKFGASDGEGSLCLWQVGLGVNMNKPYLCMKCHARVTSDFTFVGSASLLATAGQSHDGHNVCLWDTLLPSRTSLVQAFTCHESGAAAMVYSPQQQLLITGGKKGDVCLIDLRQRQLRQVFQAHDSAIKSMALHPEGHYFITGSAEGNIRVWGLSSHKLLASFEGEHARGSLFRNLGTGVTQLGCGPDNHMYSCGADGSVKIRKLPFC